MAFESRVLTALDQYDDSLANKRGPPKPKTNSCVLDTADRSAGASAGSQNLPEYSHKAYKPAPTVVYTRDEEESNDLVQAMRGPFGFDMEWKVFWQNGRYTSRKTALIQLCDNNIILLVQVSAMKRFPQELKRVIEAPEVIKMGVNIRGDGEKLFRDYGVLAANLIELGGVAYQVDPSFVAKYNRKMVSLAYMVEFYERKLLAKGPVRKSNWENNPLNENQRQYAADDAHCALVIFKKLNSLAKANRRLLNPLEYTTNIGEKYRAGKLTLTTPSPGSNDTTGTSALSFVAPQIPRKQQLRAYNLWYQGQMSLPDICAALRTKENPLKESTIISYVIQVLQADSTLPFDLKKLKDLIYQELGSWSRHGKWIMEIELRVR